MSHSFMKEENVLSEQTEAPHHLVYPVCSPSGYRGYLITRKHSSRMYTTHLLTVEGCVSREVCVSLGRYPGVCVQRGVCLSREVSRGYVQGCVCLGCVSRVYVCPGCVCVCPGGCVSRGGYVSRGVSRRCIHEVCMPPDPEAPSNPEAHPQT